MSEWDSALVALREEFLRESRARLAGAETVLQALSRNGRDGAAAEELARMFHAFAGSGATFGFPEVSALGLEGERLCDRLRREGLAPADLEQVHGLLRRIAADVARGDEPPTTARGRLAAGESGSSDILVVEDDTAFAELLEAQLCAEGFTVRHASTLADAAHAIEARRPDALVVDVTLPDGVVYPFVERLRSAPGGEALPVLAVTAKRALPDRVEAIRCGIDAFFVKAGELGGLVGRLRFLLQRERGAPGRILSVDDDPQQAEFLRMVLESAGYTFRWCSDPQAVESEVAAFRPHLVLMDVMLPGITGFDLVHVLRQDDRNAVLPIVFLTTRTRIEDRIRATASGGDEFLEKPVVPGLLLTTVAARIERARLLSSLMARDALTGLLNHGALLERIGEVVAAHERQKGPATLVMLDLDHFKAVNDLYGHGVGDRVLAVLGSFLRRRLRGSDVVGRYGGEEFAAVFEGLDLDEAARLTQRLLDEFSRQEHLAPDGSRFKLSFSAGVALLEPGMRAGEWCGCADRRLYAAKAAGRARLVARG